MGWWNSRATALRASDLLFEWRSSKVGIEALAEDGNGLIPGKIGSCRNGVVLIALISFKRPEVYPFNLLGKKVLVVLRIGGREEQDVQIWTV
jgi:hypothetical protein